MHGVTCDGERERERERGGFWFVIMTETQRPLWHVSFNIVFNIFLDHCVTKMRHGVVARVAPPHFYTVVLCENVCLGYGWGYRIT